MEGPEEIRNGISRRTALKRMGAAGAIAWATPVITSLNQKAFAQVSPGPGHQASGDIHYTVSNANPSLVRHVVFSFTEAGGTLHYDDANGCSYDVAFGWGYFDGAGNAWACGPISNAAGSCSALSGSLLFQATNGGGTCGDTPGSCPVPGPAGPFTYCADLPPISGSVTVT